MADLASPACILETRKTAPGLRLVDKWAVQIFPLLLLDIKTHTTHMFLPVEYYFFLALLYNCCCRYSLVEVKITEWAYLIW